MNQYIKNNNKLLLVILIEILDICWNSLKRLQFQFLKIINNFTNSHIDLRIFIIINIFIL